MAEIDSWSETASSNTTVGGVNVAEHCLAANLNDGIRAVMAGVKEAHNDLLDGTVTVNKATQDGAGNVIATTSYVPVGTVIWSMATSVPTGFLLCDGSTISRTTYASLFSAIGTTYGTGDGSTTFGLPNLMDKFLEGASAAGTSRSAGLPNISGGIALLAYTNNGSSSGSSTSGAFSCLYVNNVAGSLYSATGAGGFYDMGVNFYASLSNSIYGSSSTVQPPALTALPCIKY